MVKTGRTFFVADLHLTDERPAATGRFFRFLQDEVAGADALYILGDLFEAWIGDDHGEQVAGDTANDGMGQFGKLTSLKDLPPKKTLVALIRKARALSEAGVKVKRGPAKSKPAPVLPEDVAALLAMKKHAAARAHFDAFPPGAQREYVDWIGEAKTDATRQKRIATTLEWLAEGKRRHWKYESC